MRRSGGEIMLGPADGEDHAPVAGIGGPALFITSSKVTAGNFSHSTQPFHSMADAKAPSAASFPRVTTLFTADFAALAAPFAAPTAPSAALLIALPARLSTYS